MDPAQWPHIVQLSYLVYDVDADKIQSFKDVIISLGTHIPLSDESVAIHGITREMSLQRGIDIRMALFDFKMELQQCGKCVAHNYSFDSNVLQIEAQRHNMSLYFPSPIYANFRTRHLQAEATSGPNCWNCTSTCSIAPRKTRTIPKLMLSSRCDATTC